MATFYKLWVTTPGISKAEALRRAQLALLHGDVETGHDSGPSSPRPAPTYANPYYWAPFILIKLEIIRGVGFCFLVTTRAGSKSPHPMGKGFKFSERLQRKTIIIKTISDKLEP